MPRQPQLRKKTVGKSTYWFTKAGGDTYFGGVDEVAHKDAKKLFADHLVRVRAGEAERQRTRMTAGELMDLFLDWVQPRRDPQNYSTRRTYLTRFGKFQVAGRQSKLADLPADGVRGSDLEAWLARLKKDGLGAQMLRLFRRFSFPGGIGSHCTPETPGGVHEGGELGYVLHGVDEPTAAN